MLMRGANEQDSMRIIARQGEYLEANEKAARWWLKTSCNEDNRDSEADMMDLLEDCLSMKDRVFHDYSTL